MAQYIYGRLKSSDEVISILDIPKDLKDRKGWECVCPKCGVDIIARRGKIKEDHFAHKPATYGHGSGNGNGCSAVSANETALHQMAKEIIFEERKIMIPKKEIPFKELKLDLPSSVQKKLPESYLIQPASVLICEDVRKEERMADFQPDVIVVSNGLTYLIEIWRRHKTEPEKIEKVAKYGRYPMLEIDLHSFLDDPISKEELRSLITSEDRLREWIFYPNEAKLIKEARNYFESLDPVKDYFKNLSEKELRERQERERMERAEQRRQAAKERLDRDRNRMFQPENYAALLSQYRGRAGGYTKEVFSKYHFYKEVTTELPFFVNIPITGEIIFKCDRRVWQSYIFNRWIYRRADDNASIRTFSIFGEVEKYGIPVEPLLKSGKITVPSLLYDEFLPYRVVRTYLDYLEALGFVEIRGEWAAVVKRWSIIPPNKEYKDVLEAAINRLGEKKFFPNVDELLEQELESYWVEKREKAAALRRAQEEQQKREKAEAERAALERKRAAEAAQEKERIESFDFARNDVPPCYDNAGYMIVECISCHTTSRVEPRPSRVEGHPYLVTLCRNCRTKKPPYTNGTEQPSKFRGG